MDTWSYHRTSGYGMLVGLFCFLILVETFVVHLFVQHWSIIAAWMLTASSISTLLWLLADYRALAVHPIIVDAEQLQLRTGTRWRLDVPWDHIESIKPITWRSKPTPSKAYVNIASFGEPKLLLTLREPVQLRGMLGISKMVKSVGFSVDEPTTFMHQIQQYLA